MHTDWNRIKMGPRTSEFERYASAEYLYVWTCTLLYPHGTGRLTHLVSICWRPIVSPIPSYQAGRVRVLTYSSYILSILGFKPSLLFTFCRIAIQKARHISIVVIMVAVTAFHFCFLVVQINLCAPVSEHPRRLQVSKLTHQRSPSNGTPPS